ncbi:MAG: hypothetical protein RIC56_00610 [Pseudomonadales bacterium]
MTLQQSSETFRASRRLRAALGRWRAVTLICCGLGFVPAALAAEETALAEAKTSALAVMEAFLQAFNARDEAAWADSLVFPHVRVASGTVVVYPDRAAFLEAMDLTAFAEQSGWDYSTWDDLQVVQASADKVHIAVKFTRYDPKGVELASYASFYVVERVDGRWGVRARSSFAP